MFELETNFHLAWFPIIEDIVGVLSVDILEWRTDVVTIKVTMDSKSSLGGFGCQILGHLERSALFPTFVGAVRFTELFPGLVESQTFNTFL